MKKTIENINRVLVDWNPIEVPEDVAKEEYKGYIPVILQSIENHQQLLDCVVDILINSMGLDYNPMKREHLADVQAVCDRILKAYKEATQ